LWKYGSRQVGHSTTRRTTKKTFQPSVQAASFGRHFYTGFKRFLVSRLSASFPCAGNRYLRKFSFNASSLNVEIRKVKTVFILFH
jgi:hypothetical protein